jgi:hypothetical protein
MITCNVLWDMSRPVEGDGEIFLQAWIVYRIGNKTDNGPRGTFVSSMEMDFEQSLSANLTALQNKVQAEILEAHPAAGITTWRFRRP